MADSAYQYPDPVTSPPGQPPKAKPALFRRPEVAAHGVLMLFLFGIVFPSMAVLARYARPHVRDWAQIHGLIQTIAALLTLISALLVLNNDYACTKAHKQFGIAILILLGVQVAGGISHYRTLVGPAAQVPHGVYRNGRMHAALGCVIVALGAVQMPQGIHHGWRFMSREGWASPWYIVYYFLMVMWAIVVVVLEGRRQLGNRRLARKRDEGNNLYLPLTSFAPSSASSYAFSDASPADSNELAIVTAHAAASRARALNLPTVTWSEVESAIEEQAKHWIVGPGGVVYDVWKWITAHPGGPQVLLEAIGCNVSLDYFNVETFDVHRFKPFPEPPTSLSSSASQAPLVSTPECLSAATQIATRRVTQHDMNLVVAARRTHVHSPKAIAKLAPMAVARIPGAGTKFDKHEYRRYALTEYTLQQPNVVRVSFTLLYPNETYPEEPAYFLPGHCIQLRFRSAPLSPSGVHFRRPSSSPSSSKYLTRYLTPISGNMTHLTCLLKLKPNGALSTLLQSTHTLHRQWHIRGPFGMPLINPRRPLPHSNGCWDHLVFLTAGSGATPAIQALKMYFAQTYWPMACVDAHVAADQWQLSVRVGDAVMLRQVMPNGWVWANSSGSGRAGLVPLRCIGPWIGPNPKVTVVVGGRGREGVLGADMMESIAGAYPGQVSVHYRLQSPGGIGQGGSTPVQASQGRITREYVHAILNTVLHGPAHQRCQQVMVVVCGPDTFNTECAQWVFESSLIDSHSLLVLPHNAFHTRLPPPPIMVAPPTAELNPFELDAADDDDQTCILPPFPPPPERMPAMPSTGQDEDDVLWLPPVLPARVDPVTREIEWMYIPSDTLEMSAAGPDQQFLSASSSAGGVAHQEGRPSAGEVVGKA